MQEHSVYFYRLKYSPPMICCAVVCGARVKLRGREDVDVNVCGIADEPGGYGECEDIRLFFHCSKKTNLFENEGRGGVRLAGKDHDGAPSSSGERRRRKGYRVSPLFLLRLILLWKYEMNPLILFTFSSLLQDIYREETALAAGEEQKNGWRCWGGTAARRRK